MKQAQYFSAVLLKIFKTQQAKILLKHLTEVVTKSCFQEILLIIDGLL